MAILDPQELLMEDLFEIDNEPPLYNRMCEAIYLKGFAEGRVKTGNDAPYKPSASAGASVPM